MEILQTSPMQIMPFAGQINFPKHSLTLLVKATFDISHNAIATLADEQLPPTGDEYYADDESQSGSLYYPSDFAFYKPHADFIVSGKCYAPGGRAVTACPVSIQIGAHKKTLHVFGSRYWKKIHFSPETTTPQTFTEMDLRYERSFGGQDYALNPIGRGAIKADISIADNVLPVPNIQDPNNPISSPFDQTAPAGFGALHSTWQQRQKKLGSYNKKYLKTRWPWFPEDFDWSYFNTAPQDQQFKHYFRGDEKLLFENLHKKFPLFETHLPGIQPRCFIRSQHPKTKKRFFDETKLKLDTLWVDMEAQKLVLTWRGWKEILDEDFNEIKQVFLMHESMQQTPTTIETCYEYFKAAQAAEVSEFTGTEEKPATHKKKPKAKLAKVSTALPATASANASDNTELQTQINNMLAEAGVDIDKLPPSLQNEIQAQQQMLISQLDNPEQITAKTISTSEQQLKDMLANLDLDLDNLPELNPKAKQDQIRFLEKFTDDPQALQANTQLNEMWTILAAAMPKMGLDPENLSSLLEQSDIPFDEIKQKLAEKPKAQTAESISKPESATTVPQQIPANKSFTGQDLSGKDFSGMDLRNGDFSSCILSDTNFSDTNLTNAKFDYANLSRANFSRANLTGANLDFADAKSAVFDHGCCNNTSLNNTNFESISGENSSWQQAKGKDSNFVTANLKNANFSQAHLAQADFEAAELEQADFSHANLDNATFEGTKAKKSNFFKTNITGLRASLEADFSHANFSQASGEAAIFSSANLEHADLTYSDLASANFDMANLHMANASAANLVHSRFIKANMSGCKMIKANLMQASFERANLSGADIRGANCYEAEFFKTAVDGLRTDQANLAASKLVG